MPELSRRLKVISGLIKTGGSVCDVGTDHGYLPAFLYLSGNFTSVTATDLREKPLLNAKKNLKELNAEGVRLVLCDGLSKVERKEADNVVIAGMGGEIISDIISKTDFLKDETVNLVLQPTTSAKDLREFLGSDGFEVLKEMAVSENGKLYSVMQVGYSGVKRKLSDYELYIGKLDLSDETAKKYALKQLKILKKLVLDTEGIRECEEKHLNAKKIINEIENVIGEENHGS